LVPVLFPGGKAAEARS